MPTIKNKHTGKVVAGKRAVAPAIMRAAERGALPEDVRAARANLITAFTKPAGKLEATTFDHKPTGEWKRIQQAEAERKAHKMALLAYERECYLEIMQAGA